MYKDEYKRWLSQELEDPDLKPELESIRDDEEAIKDRFAIDLRFGTAGLRGVIGAGTNRMNVYTVRRATQGLARYLQKSSDNPSVAISYDSRNKSLSFAKEAACVLAANDVSSYIYPQLEPVPALSFAVRALHACAGIMITASHNPAIYNGYKAYGPDGCQLSTGASAAVTEEIEKLDIFEDVETEDFDKALKAGRISYIEENVLEAFYANVKAQTVRPGLGQKADLHIVYSPLNGAGNLPVRRVLADMGFSNVRVVPEQELPDGNFSTCPYPNPEERATLELGLRLAQCTGADLMLATDPDADRVGVAVKDSAGSYHLLTGNEIGVLLLQYICAGRKETGTMPGRPVAITSIVSTPLAGKVAKTYDVELKKVLTGFKYIGEAIAGLEQQGQKNRFLFAFEESYGYLAGTYVRDKDGVVACMLICEMAAYYKTKGLTLYEALEKLYDGYGNYLSTVDNFAFTGLSGMEKMQKIMANLRENPPAAIGDYAVTATADYDAGKNIDHLTGTSELLDLPKSNVLDYTLAGGHTVIVRPSGTEPKIKVYYTTVAPHRSEAQTIQHNLAQAIKPWMEL